MTDKFDRFKRMFLEECREHIGSLESTLAELLKGNRNASLIDDAFRAIHSVKGGAGMFGFDRIVPFAHVFESVLDGIRTGQISMAEDLLRAALRATDILADIVLAATTNTVLAQGYERLAMEALERLAGMAATKPQDLPAAGMRDRRAKPATHYKIIFRPYTTLLRRGNEPLLIISHLENLGDLQTTVDVSALPPLAELHPADACLSWIFELATVQDEAAVRDAFQFVEGECDLTIERLAPLSATSQTKPAAAAVAQPATQPAPAATIRVDTDRIDKLVNLAGEISISQALVAQLIDHSLFDSNPGLFQELSQLLAHTQNLQDSVMAIRAQPIRAIFDRMPRLVREMSEKTGKKLRLQLAGEDTEIDKTVIEQLSDPIMHMIRNSADHGIETAAERRAAGKPEEGIITLRAEQRGSRIIIEISDDGRGIDRAKVQQRAVAQKLIAGDAELSSDEIDNLLFVPGFSTADAVTSISGRGVGMDVVKRNIQKLGGRISLRSDPGRGSTIVLTLPLTLAVLEGMIVVSGGENYIIPIASILECRAPWQPAASQVPGSGEVLLVNGNYLSVVHLHRVFRHRAEADAEKSVAVIVEVEGGQSIAIIVDEILGQQQVVVKSMAPNTDAVPGIAGATILANGRVALILDTTEVGMLQASHARNHTQASSGQAASARQVA